MNMKKYIKPLLNIEKLDCCDAMASSADPIFPVFDMSDNSISVSDFGTSTPARKYSIFR